MTSVELFAGAGGLSLGLEKSGWESKMLIERDKHACNTLRLNKKLNHELAKNWNIIEGDVRNVDYTDLKSKIDLVAGGPPCQPFSLGGKHNAQHDDRDMFPEAIRAVRELEPKYFLFENVKGLLRQSFKAYFNYIIARLEFPFEEQAHGESWISHFNRIQAIKQQRVSFGSKHVYNVSFRLVNAADYGVPQHRHRVIIVGVREDLNLRYEFPDITHSLDELIRSKYINGEYWKCHNIQSENDRAIYKKTESEILRLKNGTLNFGLERYRTVYDAISVLPEPAEGKINEIGNNHVLRLGAKPYPGHTGSPIHFPSKAIKAGDHGVPGGENMIAYSDGTYRYYTTREAANIQTFPNDYIFTGSWTESMRQIGNAVPVKLAEVLGKSLSELTEELIDKRQSQTVEAI